MNSLVGSRQICESDIEEVLAQYSSFLYEVVPQNHHGQATVELGFSINKQVEVENSEEKSYIAQRLNCDFLGDVGGVKELHNLRISMMLRSCTANVRHRYSSYIDEQKLAAKTAVKRKNDWDGEEI
ncbi:hypothetical protein PR048_008127 [Dryococelus australis]|uniref:Uncharacterized protein n=1 Tax=Dryococelus australis TaxID=614101 RepID=A0ABQ9HWC5_9NEOP|nr:hypothetical protein PR048_008127 [Dryococelus australis]